MNLSFLQKKVVPIGVVVDLAVFFFFFVFALCMFHATLFRWGDLIIDTLREFYIPSAILNGKVLYRDIYYEYGFFAPYSIAGWFKIFGTSMLSLSSCGLITALATVFGIYKTASIFVNKFLSWLIGLIFLLVFAFGHYTPTGIFNFILPYSFASTFFIVFLIWGIYCFLKFIFSGRRCYFFTWAALLALAFAARIDFSLLVWFGFSLSFVAYNAFSKQSFSRNAILFLPVGIALIFYFCFFSVTGSFWQFQNYFLIYAVKAKGSFFTHAVIGLDDIRGHLITIGFSLLWQAMLLSVAFFSAVLSGLALARIKGVLRLFIVAIVCFLFIGAGIYLVNRWIYFFIQYNALPVLLVIGAICVLWKAIVGNDTKFYISLFTLFIISLAILSRIFFNVNPNLYGFFLIVPGLVAYYILYYRLAADFFQKYIKSFSYASFAIVLSVVFTFQALLFWQLDDIYYRYKGFVVKTGKGVFASYLDGRTMAYWSTVEYLLQNTKRSDTLLVVPEGVGINFFTNRSNPTPYVYLQPESFVVFGEDKIIADVAKARVDYIVFTARDTGDHGARFFGTDYAQKFYAWILNNYTLVQQFGPYPFTSPGFGIVVFKRKN
jgi:hypothetical protein